MKKPNWNDIKDNIHFYSSMILVIGFILIVVVFNISNTVDTVSKRVKDSRKLQEKYEYLDTHSVWSELDEMYDYAQAHHISNDDGNDMWDFESAWCEVYAYCEAASYIAENR